MSALIATVLAWLGSVTQPYRELDATDVTALVVLLAVLGVLATGMLMVTDDELEEQ